MNNKEYIGQLIEKYLDGDTTNKEEQTLRGYFGRTDAADIPEEWRVYRALFCYIEANAVKPVANPATEQHSPKTARPLAAVLKLTPLKVAAAVVVLMALAVWPRGPKSYVVIDGKVSTDKALMEREAEEALSLVAAGAADDDPFGALRLMEQ